MNEWIHTHIVYIYIYIDIYIWRCIGYILAVRNLMLQGLQVGFCGSPVGARLGHLSGAGQRLSRHAASGRSLGSQVRGAAKRQRCDIRNLETISRKHPKTSLSKRHSVWSLIVLIDLWNLWNLENHNHPAFFHFFFLKIGPWYGQTIEVAARSLSASPWGWRCGMWSDSMPLGGNGGGCRKVCRRDGCLKIEMVHISRFPAFLSILRWLYVYIHIIYIYLNYIYIDFIQI